MENFNQFKFHIAEKELYYQGEVIVRYSIEYAEKISSASEHKSEIFNHENRKLALKLKQFAEGELYQQAKENYEYNKAYGFPIMIYELMQECKIKNN